MISKSFTHEKQTRLPTLELNPDTLIILKNSLLHIGASPYEDFDTFSTSILQKMDKVPLQLIKELIKFKTNPSYPGGMLIKNLPTDNHLPLTPIDGKRSKKKSTFVSEGVLTLIAQLLGDIFSYKTEKNGELIHDIAPALGKTDARSNEGSSQDFLLHTELAYFKYKPDYLLLYCLKSNHENNVGYTTLAFTKNAIEKLEKNDLALLRKPIYELSIPESFNRNLKVVKKVLYGPINNPQICINFNNMTCNDSKGKKALLHLKKALESEACFMKIFLNPGDLLIIDNRKAVHGRTPFQAKFDGTDRWLQRVYLRTNLWSVRKLIEDSPRVLSLA